MEISFICVVIGVLGTYLEFILGHISRSSKHRFFQWGTFLASYLSCTTHTIALGLMPKEDNAGVWILHLVIVSNPLVAYDGEHILQSISSVVNFAIIGFKAFRIVSHTDLPVGAPSAIPKSFTIAFIVVCALWRFLITYEMNSKFASEEIDIRMREQYPPQSNSSNLYGYKYLVDSSVTVEDIYVPVDERAQGKDLCLSFALFRLLFRRCQGFTCHEAVAPETRALVLDHLLPKVPPAPIEKIERGFSVVEVELSFLHDHIHRGYVVWSGVNYISYYYPFVVCTVLKCLLMYIGCLLLSRDLKSYLLVGSQILFDVLQIILYCNSNKWMVYHMCRRRPGVQVHLIGLVDRFIAWFNLKKVLPGNYYWQDRIGQYSLLEEQRSMNAFALIAWLPHVIFNGISSLFPKRTLIAAHTARKSAPVVLPFDLKTRITNVLGDSGDGLDGVPSLETLIPSRPLENGIAAGSIVVDKIKIILTWHLATSYCEFAYGSKNLEPVPGYQIAMNLSRYCAYLVAFRPKLLQGNEADTRYMFSKVLAEVRKLRSPITLNSLRVRIKDGNVKLNEWNELSKEDSKIEPLSVEYLILTDGLNLGSHLNNVDDANRWKILENIWLKLALSIVKQDAEPHTKCLAQGGEFLTHLWAILTHAGIIKEKEWSPSRVYASGHSKEFIKELLDGYTDKFVKCL